MVSIIETMRYKYGTIATIFIAISAIGCAGDGQGIKAIPSSNSNSIVRQGVPIPQTPQSGQPSTLNALPDATVVMEQPAGSRLVVYRSGSFSPDRLDVDPGDIVAFVNESHSAMWPASNIHPTHEILSEFDAGKLVPPDGFWLFEFVDSGFWRYHNHLLFSSSGLVVVSGSGAIRSPPIVLLELPEFQTLDVATLKDAADLFEYDDALDATSRNTGRHAQSGSCLKAQRH